MITRLLRWADATQDDIVDLQAFECTTPPDKSAKTHWKTIYSRPYEGVAERIVHRLAPTKSTGRHQRIWLGRDDEGLAAVLAWTWRPSSSARVDVVALHRRLRKSGSRYTDEMLDTGLSQIAGEAAARGTRRLTIYGSIHAQNRTSRYFATRCDMRPIDDHPDHDGYFTYSVTLGFADVT